MLKYTRATRQLQSQLWKGGIGYSSGFSASNQYPVSGVMLADAAYSTAYSSLPHGKWSRKRQLKEKLSLMKSLAEKEA